MAAGRQVVNVSQSGANTATTKDEWTSWGAGWTSNWMYQSSNEKPSPQRISKILFGMMMAGVSKIGVVPTNDGLEWKTLLKWMIMIWGYHYFRKHPWCPKKTSSGTLLLLNPPVGSEIWTPKKPPKKSRPFWAEICHPKLRV